MISFLECCIDTVLQVLKSLLGYDYPQTVFLTVQTKGNLLNKNPNLDFGIKCLFDLMSNSKTVFGQGFICTGITI